MLYIFINSSSTSMKITKTANISLKNTVNQKWILIEYKLSKIEKLLINYLSTLNVFIDLFIIKNL